MTQTSESVLNVYGRTEALTRLIKNKTVCICLHGKSITELENRIDDFKGLNICWAGQNRYNIIQKYILDKINESFNVVLDIGTVRNNEEYNKVIRIPRMEGIIRKNPNCLILTTQKIFDSLKKNNNLLLINPILNCLFIDVENCNFSIPNSLTLYLLILTYYEAKRIILFGFDGFGNPKAFIRERLDNSVQLDIGYKDRKDEIDTYYKPELVKRDRSIGFGNPNMSCLFSDGPLFNDQFLTIYKKYCLDMQILPIKIYNCNINSMFTIFEKITYNRAIELCIT